MVAALKPGGYMIFSIEDQYLDAETDFGSGYGQELTRLTQQG